MIIKGNLVGMLKFSQAPLVLKPHTPVSSSVGMSYRDFYLSGSETLLSLPPCFQDP